MQSKHLQTQSDANAPLAGAATPVLAAAAVLLAVTWSAAWGFGLGEAVTLALTLAIVILALLAVGARLSVGREPMLATDSGPAPLDDRVGVQVARRRLDPLTAELLGPTQCKRWSLDVFAAIDAQRFAAVCETWFAWAGFDTRAESHRNSEGVDIWLHAAKMPGPVAIVRCRHPQDRPVGLREMQEFQGVVANCHSAHGTFTTTSTYTPEALSYAREHGIDAVDGKELLRKIRTRTRQSQQALLAVAFNGR